ncbi:MAG: hypothetical protein J5806_09230 [Lentisphaeria bacterium]|nr:hypothetical protein [Lentisphaeria bacterium]
MEQLRKLDKLRKQVQTILSTHYLLLIIIFVLILGAFLTFLGIQATYSPSRYLARLTLCFHPKHKGKTIGQYDDKYVMRILNRRATRQRFCEQGDVKDTSRKRISGLINIGMDKKQPHNFSIELYAGSEEDAVAFINQFAAICVQEYCNERTIDLKKWKEVLEKEKESIYKDVQEVNAKISELTVPMQMISPEKDYERLRQHINEIQTARTRLTLVLENLFRRKKQLETELAAVNPKLLAHQKEIKEYFRELDQLDREIALATELYTDENPKMITLHSRRAAVQKRLDAFLAENQIKSADPQSIRLAETLSAELKTLMTDLENKQNEKQVLDGEIAESTKRLRLFTESQPRLQQLTQQRRNLRESMDRLDESISEINYMLLMVREDLFVNENARSAVGNPPFTKKTIAICLFAAIVLTAFLAALVALVEFFFGSIANARELMLYDEFHFLGVLPTSEELFKSADREKVSFNNLFHNFQAVGSHVVFTGALPGARIIPQFFEFLEWNFAMAGKRVLVMEMVLAEEFEAAQSSGSSSSPDNNNLDTMLVTFSGGKCFLPVASKKFLSPSEFELLKNDFNILKEQYDYIFIRHSFPLRRSKLFLEQIASFCDGALFAVGSGKTPRKYLRALLSAQIKINIPVMTILSDNAVEKLKKDLKMEEEE